MKRLLKVQRIKINSFKFSTKKKFKKMDKLEKVKRKEKKKIFF